MLHCKFSGDYNSERIFKISQYLTKLCAEHLGFTFLAHPVYIHRSMQSVPCRLDDIAEGWLPPGPGAVSDHVSPVGDEWSVVCVELAGLGGRLVVVRVTDR